MVMILDQRIVVSQVSLMGVTNYKLQKENKVVETKLGEVMLLMMYLTSVHSARMCINLQAPSEYMSQQSIIAYTRRNFN